MDVLPSPLNLAHQEGRKAERLLESGKLEEAIQYHQRIVELLKESLNHTSSQEAATSISLQQKQHQVRYKLLTIQLKAKAEKANSESITSRKMSSLKMELSETDSSPVKSDYDMALRTIDECDSLLQFLERRSGDASMAPSAHMTKLSSLRPASGGTKMPKDDKTVIEELRQINVALRHHITDLLKESEMRENELIEVKRENNHYQRENALLKARLEQLEKSTKLCDISLEKSSEDYYPFPAGLNVEDLSSLELPPLEMPKFDFDSLKGASPHWESPKNN